MEGIFTLPHNWARLPQFLAKHFKASKLVPCAGLFNDYLDADGPDGADGPEECDQPPSASAKRHRQSLQQSASSLLSAGPSSASPRPGPAGGGQSQGHRHGPIGKLATGMMFGR